MRFGAILFLFLNILISLGYAQTSLSGLISVDTILTKKGSPYNITGNVIVQNAKMTIDPGVVVKFFGSNQLAVQNNGSLICLGSATDSIYFTSDGSPNNRRIYFAPEAIGTQVTDDTLYQSGSIFDYCVFESLGLVKDYFGDNYNGTVSTQVDLLFSHSVFRHLSATAYSATVYNLNSTAYFNQCVFYRNICSTGLLGWAGLGSRVLTNCTIRENTSNSYALFGSKTRIKHSLFEKNNGCLFYHWQSGQFPLFDISETKFISNQGNTLFRANSGTSSTYYVFDNSNIKRCQFIGNNYSIGFEAQLNHITFDSCSFYEPTFSGKYFRGGGIRVKNSIINVKSDIILETNFPEESPDTADVRYNYWATTILSSVMNNIEDQHKNVLRTKALVEPILLASPDGVYPVPPDSLKIIETASTSISLHWNANSGNISGYKVYYATDSPGYPYENSVDAGNTTNYTLSNLVLGQKYYIAVTAYDKDGNASWYSNEVTASTTPAPRISADLSSIDFGTVDVRTNNAKSLKITNTGTAALNLKTIQLVNTSFGYSLNTRKLEPGTSTTFIALFSPKSTGAYKVDLKIISDAVNDSILVIPVTGYAVPSKAPYIVSVNDVPNDQGGQVRITFQASRYDGVDSLQKISSYSVWRKMDENKWDAINQFNAVGDSLYYVVAPSLGDSTLNGAVWSTYRVTAHTTDPLIFYTSEPASGYSKDNIAPEVPKGFTASVANNRVYLKWNPSKEKDFQYYAIYRSTDPNFSADTMKKYTYTTIDTAYVDNNVSMNQKYYYKIAAVDYAGNRSTSTNAEIAVLSDVNDKNKNIPTEYALEQNFPNPFNPSTIIRYSLPYDSRVQISIFNSLGQLVRDLVDKVESSGNYEKTFNAVNLPSGIYIYSISVQSTDGKNSFSSVKKMMLVK